ncbi:M24 family metallopeptidase [Edaphobacter aggregans]|uniref:M24 family metallopeptidase n=1 Tax=Edaphobacter aggregans TaxID=570835 RepID=UPI0005538C64|nr:Xaa-Pro peptidase family protein [Edaphobacter aggregans]
MKLRCVLALVFLCTPITLCALDSVPKAEYRQRRVALAGKLEGGVAVLFAAEEPVLDFMPYRQDEDFYYLTGWNEPGAALVIIGPGPERTTRLGDVVPAHGYSEILFLPARDLITEKYTGAKLDAASPGAAEKIGVDAVMPITSLPEVMTKFVGEDRRRGQTIWSQLDSQQSKAAVDFSAAALGIGAGLQAHDVRTLTMALRTVKSPAEIELIRKATNASMASQLAGMRAIKPGVRERMVAGVEIAKMMQEGCERPSYAPIVGSGENSTTLHYSENSATMKAGGVVVIDEAGEYSMYASDITRTMPVDGHFTARQKEIYDIVLGAQRAASAAFVAGKMRLGGVTQRGPEVKDTLDKVAFDYINTHGKDLHGEPLGKYFVHGLGHSVGINVHDPMDYSKPLDKGMVFTIEPGIYIPEEGIGVRIEDVFYVDADGKLVDLVADLPHEASGVEAAMKQ